MEYSTESKSFYADRLDKIQDEISPEDLLWAGGYILGTMNSLVVNEGVVQEPPYLWKTESTFVIKAEDDVFNEGKDKPLNSKLYTFLDYINTEFYLPMYDKILTPNCLTVYTGCIFDGTTLRTYKYDGLRNMFTNRPYKNADMMTRTAISVLPELMYKRYANPSDGYPFSFSSRDEWNEVLDKMIAAFKLSLYDSHLTGLNVSTTYGDLIDMYKEGTELYGKYLGNL